MGVPGAASHPPGLRPDSCVPHKALGAGKAPEWRGGVDSDLPLFIEI